jgi:hypothetical protein
MTSGLTDDDLRRLRAMRKEHRSLLKDLGRCRMPRNADGQKVKGETESILLEMAKARLRAWKIG